MGASLLYLPISKDRVEIGVQRRSIQPHSQLVKAHMHLMHRATPPESPWYTAAAPNPILPTLSRQRPPQTIWTSRKKMTELADLAGMLTSHAPKSQIWNSEAIPEYTDMFLESLCFLDVFYC